MDTPIHEVVHTLIVCIKQSNGVFHMGMPMINKAIYYTLAMGAYGETIGDLEDFARKLEEGSESSWQPLD